MKNRERQKANRKLKMQLQRGEIATAEFIGPKSRSDKPWLNSEGYHDPTAYVALRNIEKAGRQTAQTNS